MRKFLSWLTAAYLVGGSALAANQENVAANLLKPLPTSEQEIEALRASIPDWVVDSAKKRPSLSRDCPNADKVSNQTWQETDVKQKWGEDTVAALVHDLRRPNYRAFAQFHNQILKTGQISTVDVEKFYKAHVAISNLEAAHVSGHLNDWKVKQDETALKAALFLNSLFSEVFPSLSITFNEADDYYPYDWVSQVEKGDYWHSLGSHVKGNPEARSFLEMPVVERGAYIRPRTECEDATLVSADVILKVKESLRNLKSPFLMEIGQERLDTLLNFPQGCVCQDETTAKAIIQGVNGRLVAHKLKLTPSQAEISFGSKTCSQGD